MMLFDRDYLLTIITDTQTVEIKPPLRVAFSATKSTSRKLNKCTVTIYNLKESTRLALLKDDQDGKKIQFKLLCGYAGQLKSIFQGQVLRGDTFRSGADYTTTLEALDGGHDLYTAPIAKTVKGKENVFKQLTEDSDTKVGVITQQSELTRPRVLMGNVIKVIDDLVEDGQDWYIDDGKLYIVKDSEAVDSFVPVASAESGLINTPTREKLIIEFTSLVNPSFEIGKIVQLLSVTAPHLNGLHKITEINYSGDLDGQAWQMTVKCKVGDYDRLK